MKKLFLLLFPGLLFGQSNFVSFARSTSDNYYFGIINVDNGNPTMDYLFYDNGAPPLGNFVESNGFIFDTTGNWGTTPVLYKYNVNTEEFQTVEPFDTSESYFKPMVSAGNIVYGIRNHFFSGKTLVEYNTATNTDTEIYSFNASTINGIVDMIEENGILYGITTGGSGYDSILFSYDLSTDTYSEIHIFNDGSGTTLDILKHSNGKIYGTTKWGGANNKGYLFEYDIQLDSFSVAYNCTSDLAIYNLVEGDNGYIYGFTKTTTLSGTGKICRFDPTTNTLTNLYSFVTGVAPPSAQQYYPLVFRNGILYGINCIDTGNLLTADTAMVFSYDIAGNTFNSITQDFYIDGSFDRHFSPLYKTSDGTILFTTSAGVKGKLMKIENGSTIPIEADGTKFGTDGIKPKKMIRTSENLFYGICSGGGTTGYGESLFLYNIETGEYQVKALFQKEIGVYPTDIVQASNGKIFISTLYGENYFDGMGSILEYDPISESLTLVHDFDNSFATNAVSELHFFEKNNIIYGVKGFGGNGQLYSGTIFSINANTLEYNVIYESTEIANNPYSFFTSNGVIYGIAKYGGANGQGYLYSFNPQSDQFSVITDLDTFGSAYFTEAPNGDIYGTFQYSHSQDGAGSLFKIDSNTQSFSVLLEFPIDFNDLSTLITPSLIEIRNDFLYVRTIDYNPPFSAPSLMSFNITDSTTHHFNYIDNTNGLYPMSDGSLFGTTYLEAVDLPSKVYSIEPGDIDATTVFDMSSGFGNWYNIIDLDSEYLALPEYNIADINYSLAENPIDDYISISGNLENVHVTIFNGFGQQVYPELKIESKLNVQNLTSGFYLLKIQKSNGSSQTIRFIKK